MLKDLIAFFNGPADVLLRTEDQRLALAALMVRIARADEDFSSPERAAILVQLRRRHTLTRAEADALLAEAEKAEAEAPDTVRFTRLLKAAVPHEDRTDLMEALWRIVLADGVREQHEDALMRQLAPLLGVSDRDNAHARQRADAG
jgi:uncharacterized tellurite resistance protein B-like protein